ncbi:phage portal protein [Paenibacillus selenitireducens]|uniref:Phage portal protein n=2 Tax=Paenibacillus selenitireducens TaxID=1324314 RepID=A0A1T2XAZ3_9BACL|nr:phage portal protein [Paenibacillus selenitireducens]
MQEISRILQNGAASAMNLEQIIQTEISEWKTSEKRKLMLVGARYYRNRTDIMDRERTAIGENGVKEIVGNLANNKLVNAFVRKLVDQKVGYLLSKPLSIQTDNPTYQAELTAFFDKSMLRMLQNIGKESINKGIAWLHVYYDTNGQLSFKRIPSEQIIPLWKDEAHSELDAVIRMYEVEVYEGIRRTIVNKVEWWDTNGVRRYTTQGGLTPDIEAGDEGSHFGVNVNGKEQGLNWDRVPFIAFKYNEEEQPLVEIIKSLVDDYDNKKSDNANNLEDLPNSIYVVKGFGGSEAGEIRKNLSTFRIVKIDDTDSNSGVDTISLTIDTEAFKTHMSMNRKDIYEFGRGVDTQSDKLGGDKSGVALRFLYADLDMDANIIETEFQAALEQLRWFLDVHIANTGSGDYSNDSVDFIFNRDIVINETEAVDNADKSKGVISDETIVANHPWVTDAKEEMNRLSKQREEETKRMANADYPGFTVPPAGE